MMLTNRYELFENLLNLYYQESTDKQYADTIVKSYRAEWFYSNNNPKEYRKFLQGMVKVGRDHGLNKKLSYLIMKAYLDTINPSDPLVQMKGAPYYAFKALDRYGLVEKRESK